MPKYYRVEPASHYLTAREALKGIVGRGYVVVQSFPHSKTKLISKTFRNFKDAEAYAFKRGEG